MQLPEQALHVLNQFATEMARHEQPAQLSHDKELTYGHHQVLHLFISLKRF